MLNYRKYNLMKHTQPSFKGEVPSIYQVATTRLHEDVEAALLLGDIYVRNWLPTDWQAIKSSQS